MRNHTVSGWFSVLSVVIVLAVLSAGLACHATPSPSPWDKMLIKHKWDAIPDNWVSLGQPPNGTTIKLHIALKANRENALFGALNEVSHPRHPKYGMHLSREQVAELVAPHPDTLELVYSWLTFNSVPPSSISMTRGGSWLTVAGVPISKANKILGASYELYYHAWANATILRTVSYALPTALHMHVKTVSPTTAFTSTRLLQQTQLSLPDGETAPANVTSGKSSDVLQRVEKKYVQPSFLRWLYSMPFDNPTPTDRNKLGIAGFANQFPNIKDRLRFIRDFRSDVDATTAANRIVTVVPVNNGVDKPTFAGRQGNLDTQYSVALTYPTQIEYYTIGGSNLVGEEGLPMDGDDYLEWLQYMINLQNIPWTISVPYSTRELDLPKEYADYLCELFARITSRGVSILVASGDEGVGNGIRGSASGFLFSPSFPASCPHVTSVGGTSGFNPELGSIISGGGFSNFFGRPDYQKDAVPPFLGNLGSKYTGFYNPQGRGVPDIAMQSMDYAVVFRGRTFPMSSTSFSTNTAAAAIALLNDYLVKHNRNPLGFLNNWLYEAGMHWDGLNDVTGGNNPGANTEGFSAMVGWDPVTGLGSLNYTLLLRHLIKWR